MEDKVGVVKKEKKESRIKASLLEWKESFRKYKVLYLMLVPFVLWFLVFKYKPMGGLVIAFQDYSIFKGILGSEWVGLNNFVRFFSSEYFLRTIKNTIFISLGSLVIGFPLPIILALLLNEVKNKFYRSTVQTFTFIPFFVSTVVIAGIVTNFLAPETGIVNVILERIGLDSVYFLTKPEWFRTIYIGAMVVWKTTGYNAIIYIAAIAGINPSLYEAATMDGAGRFKQMIHITLPSILPTIVIMLILAVGRMMNVGYEAVMLLYQPATYETADIINTYVYRVGLQGADYGLATAAGLFNAVVSLILVVGANKLSKKLTSNGLW